MLNLFKDIPTDVYSLMTPQARALARLAVERHGTNRKISCIKSFREVSTCGLKEAKDCIEAVINAEF